MAVYTHVDEDALSGFLQGYDLGAPLSLKGIAEGVENSNYLLETEKGRFILTLYEKRVSPADLPFFIGLMDHLAEQDLPCARPQHRKDGSAIGTLAGRPAAIVSFLDGLSTTHPQTVHCEAVGAALADLHRAGAQFDGTRANSMGVATWSPFAERIGARADTVEPGLAKLIADECAFQSAHWPAELEAGIIHADLFPDNVLFIGKRLTGLIDFYFSCTDLFAYDIAVCLNAWCFDESETFDTDKCVAFMKGYRSVRTPHADEIAALPLLCRASALRFLLTRTLDWIERIEGALVAPKDPLEFARRLRFHQSVQHPSAYGLA